MDEVKVGKEVAEAEFDRFIEEMDIDADKEGMDDEDRKAFDAAKRLFVRAVMNGSLAVDEQGRPVFTPKSGGSPIVFNEPTGASLMASDAHKKNHDVAKMFAILGDITGRDKKVFARMPRRDLNVCQTIVTLFLG